MKLYIITVVFSALSYVSFAQDVAPSKPIRETLFGASYKADMQKQSASSSSARRVAAKPTGTSTKAMLFTDYRPSTSSASRRAAAVPAAKTTTPSSVSAKEAAAKAPKPTAVKFPVLQAEPSTPAPTVKKVVTPAAKKN